MREFYMQNMRQFLTGILTLAIMCTAMSATGYAGTLEDIKARGKLIVGVKSDYEPFGYVDATGKNVGFDVDIAHLFAKALLGDENKVELVAVTSANRIPFLQSNKIDIIIASLTVTEERKQVVEFSDPYFLSGGLLLVTKDSGIKGLEDMAGKTAAVIQGSWEDKALEQLAPKTERVKLPKVTDAVLALKGGRVQAYIHDDIVILAEAKKDPTLAAAGKAFTPQPFAIAVRKGDTEFVKWVNERLAELRKDGTYDKLWQTHFKEMDAFLLKP
jgi:ABC-type amino acid transport substrate-binding protein